MPREVLLRRRSPILLFCLLMTSIFHPALAAETQDVAPIMLGVQTPIGQDCYEISKQAGTAVLCAEQVPFDKVAINALTGSCEIALSVDRSGKVTKVDVLAIRSTQHWIEGVCRRSAKKWRFSPPKSSSKTATALAGIYAKIIIGPNEDLFTLDNRLNQRARINFTLSASELEKVIARLGSKPTLAEGKTDSP